MAHTHLSLQILPRVASEDLYPLVDEVIDLIKKSGLPHIIGPMETTIEGELDQLLDIVKKAQEHCLAWGAERCLAVVKIDTKKDRISFDEKLHQYR